MTKIGARIAAVAAFMVTLAACGGSAAPAAQTDVGVTSNSILLGNTIAQSGPAAAYGTIANAELAYFTYINNTQWGVNGREITFKILDYAQNCLKGLKDGLGFTASMIVAAGRYDVTAASTASQLATLKAKGADTLFLFTTPSFTTKSLVITTALHWEPTIYLNSVSNPQVYMGIAAKAGAALKNVTSVGYIKDPTDPTWASDAGMQP